MTSSSDFYASKAVAHDDIMVPILRQRLDKWVNAIPHHPYLDLAKKSQFLAVTHCPVYLVEIMTQFEKRSVQYHRTPYRRQGNPGVIPDFSNLYSIKLNPTTDYATQSFQYTYWGSVELCRSCSGNGYQICYSCHGVRVFTCSQCSGKGNVKCTTCYGSGKTQCNDCDYFGRVSKTCISCYGEGQVKGWNTRCWTCNGTGRSGGTTCWSCSGAGEKMQMVNCSLCHGTGSVSATCSNCWGTRQVSCSRCYGRGEETCYYCHGTGQNSCSTCNGNGKLGCSDCEKVGKLINYAVLSQVLYSEKAAAHSKSNLLKTFPNILVAREQCRTDACFVIKKQILTDNLVFGDTGISSIVKKISGDVREKFVERGYVLFQDLTVSQLDAYILNCQYNKSNFNFLVYGTGMFVVDNDSPVKRFKADMTQTAMELYDDGKLVECLDHAVKLDDMNKAMGMRSNIAFKVRSKIYQAYTMGIAVATLLSLYCLPLLIPMLKYIRGYDPSSAFEIQYILAAMALCNVLIILPSVLICKKKWGIKVPGKGKRFMMGLLTTLILNLVFDAAWMVGSSAPAMFPILF
jgi:hypothetical protein